MQVVRSSVNPAVLVLDFTDNEPSLALKEGVLALQLHAGKPMWAEFKNIRIKAIK